MKFSIITILLLVVNIASAQIRWERLTAVETTDAAAPALKEWVTDKQATYQKGGLVIPIFSTWAELPFESLKTLFPNYRFFAISWSERAVPGREKEAIGLAISLETTVVCDASGKIVKELLHWGNYVAFGEFMKSEKLSIRSEADANQIWIAFCDAHQRHWQSQPAEKIDDRTWRLGNNTIDKFHYYYEVRVAADSIVEGAKFHAEEIGRPRL